MGFNDASIPHTPLKCNNSFESLQHFESMLWWTHTPEATAVFLETHLYSNTYLFTLALLNQNLLVCISKQLNFTAYPEGNYGYKTAGFNGCRTITPTHAKGLTGLAQSVPRCLAVGLFKSGWEGHPRFPFRQRKHPKTMVWVSLNLYMRSSSTLPSSYCPMFMSVHTKRKGTPGEPCCTRWPCTSLHFELPANTPGVKLNTLISTHVI